MDKRAEYTIGIKSEGLDALTKVIDELDKAGVETSEFKREAALLRQQLQEMQQQQQLIDSFAKIKQETTAAASAFEAAQQKAQQLGREMAATEAPTKKQVTDFARAREAVNSTKDAYQATQLRLQSMRGTLAENSIETTGLAQKQALLRNGVRDVETSVAGATARLKELGSSGPKAVSDTAAATDRATASTKGYQGSLTQVAQAVAGVFAVSQVANYAVGINQVADQFKNLEARVRLAVGAQVDLKTAVAGIAQVAKDTHSNLDATAELFGRLAASGKELNITNAEALGITKTINQSIQVSGASAQASEASVRQLVQALQSGTLRGDEFNSIMEQAPRLAKALADGLQVPVGALRGMAEQGELTSARVVKALKGQADAINAEFASLPLTTGRALEDLRTQWTLFIGGLDASTGASSYVAAGINALAGNLETLARVAGLAGAALTASLAIQGVAALRAYAAEAAMAAGATNLLTASINKVPKSLNIAVGVTGFEVGYWVGEKLHENSELARKLGVGIVGYFEIVVNSLRLAKEAAAAVFTSDTVDAAYDRYTQRNQQVRESIQAMMGDAKDAPSKVADAANQSGAALQGLGQTGLQAGQAVATGAAAGAAGLSSVKAEATDALGIFKALQLEAQKPQPKRGAVTEIVEQLVDARKKGLDLDALFRKELPDALSKLSGAELAKFRDEFTKSMQLAGATGKELQTGLRLIGEQAATSLGVDVRVASNQVSEGFRKADEDMRMLILSMPALKAAGVDTGQVVGEALAKMLDGAKSQAEVDAVRQRIQALRKDLGDKLADGLLDQAAEKVRQIGDAADKARPGINSLREAMTELGLKTREEMSASAARAEQAYGVIKQKGQEEGESYVAWQARKAAAARTVIERLIESNGGIADASTKAKAAAEGIELAADSAGKTIVRSMSDARNGTESVGNAARQSAGGFQNMAERAAAAAEQTQRLQSIYDRHRLTAPGGDGTPGGAGGGGPGQKKSELQKLYERNQMGDFKSTVGKSGDVREAAVMDTDINQAIVKRYGEEMLDNPLAKKAWQLRLQLESYQKNYGAGRSKQSLDQQRNIAAELARVEAEIEQARQEQEKKSQTASGGTTRQKSSGGGLFSGPTTAAPSPAPAPVAQGVSAGPTTTFVSNITLPNGRQETVRYPDADSQATNERLLKSLAVGKGVYQ